MSATINVLRPDGKGGGSMLISEYHAIRYFILIHLKETETVSITELLEQSEAFFTLHNLSWDILKVKLDLQARGLIKLFTKPNSRRVTSLKLTHEGVKLITKLKKDSTDCCCKF